MATKLSKAAAVAELAYRDLAKPRPSRTDHELFERISARQQHLAFNASGDALRAAAGVEAKPAPGRKVTVRTTASSRKQAAALKAKANAAYRKAHAAAPEGQKMKAGRAAFKAVFVAAGKAA